MKLSKILMLALAALLMHGLAQGQNLLVKSTGQTLYLPVYSHVWHGDINKRGKPFKALMSVAVSIRNTDQLSPIKLTSAGYYDTDGRKIKDYIVSPRVIMPMATYELFVPWADDAGGSGANFIIEWQSGQESTQPVVEAIHADLAAGKSVIFVTTAYVLHGK